ncbi:MAG: hypothetical protein ACQCN6_04420 [Candidatus Bathyarchaeia archaeon]
MEEKYTCRTETAKETKQPQNTTVSDCSLVASRKPPYPVATTSLQVVADADAKKQPVAQSTGCCCV